MSLGEETRFVERGSLAKLFIIGRLVRFALDPAQRFSKGRFQASQMVI